MNWKQQRHSVASPFQRGEFSGRTHFSPFYHAVVVFCCFPAQLLSRLLGKPLFEMCWFYSLFFLLARLKNEKCQTICLGGGGTLCPSCHVLAYNWASTRTNVLKNLTFPNCEFGKGQYAFYPKK